jgi:monoamine oxidase
VGIVRIVIVGAGVSGLTCARRLTNLLKKQPHKITIVEARDRIGGRTYSIPELNLDLGASWILSSHTAVRALVRELNISTLEQYNTGASLIDTMNGNIQRRIMSGMYGGAKRVKGGTGRLCATIFNELTTQNEATVTVQLNSPVTDITCKDDGLIIMTLQDHRSLLADYVVLAAPPKLLVASVKLTPNLPPSVTRQLNTCVTWMASTCKAILVYDRRWWRDRNLSGFAVSHQSNVQEWHDASSETCNALFVFCLAGTTKQEIIEATIRMFGDNAKSPTAVHMTDWSSEIFTSSSNTDGQGGHPHVGDICRQPHWNGRLWLGSSEVSDTDGGYLEGAVRRAIQVADQLVELLKTRQTIT